MSKHTPAPWIVAGPYPSVSVVVCVDGGSGYPDPHPPSYEPVCIVDQRTEGEPSALALADARLIAAAPDLLASLLEIVAEWGYPNTPKWHRAKAAIAKAEGK
jgi:hypothetical protein